MHCLLTGVVGTSVEDFGRLNGVLGVDVMFMIPIPGHTRALTDII